MDAKAGVSVYLQGVNGQDKVQLTRFLLSRGMWLIVLELTVLAFGLNFALPFLFLQVIWAIGASMILLAGVIWLPRAAAAIIGAAIVGGHQLLAPIDPADVGAFAPLWTLAFRIRSCVRARLHLVPGDSVVWRDVPRLRRRARVHARAGASQPHTARACAERNRVVLGASRHQRLRRSGALESVS